MMAHDSPWRFVYGCALAMTVAVAMTAGTRLDAQGAPATIRACVAGGGTLRIVGANETCKGGGPR